MDLSNSTSWSQWVWPDSCNCNYMHTFDCENQSIRVSDYYWLKSINFNKLQTHTLKVHNIINCAAISNHRPHIHNRMVIKHCRKFIVTQVIRYEYWFLSRGPQTFKDLIACKMTPFTVWIENWSSQSSRQKLALLLRLFVNLESFNRSNGIWKWCEVSLSS